MHNAEVGIVDVDRPLDGAFARRHNAAQRRVVVGAVFAAELLDCLLSVVPAKSW